MKPSFHPTTNLLRGLLALSLASVLVPVTRAQDQTSTQTTTNTSTSSAAPQATAAYSNVLNQAANVAATPYQAYTGQLTAPVNSQQTAGIAGVQPEVHRLDHGLQRAE